MANRALYGYNGRFLRVDLSNRRISVEEPSVDYFQRYLGGRGFVAPILLQELRGGVDPDNLREAQRLYYQMLGWDQQGTPCRSRLVELDIEWAEGHLPAAG